MPNPQNLEVGPLACSAICVRIAEAEKHLAILSKQIRTLQLIVIGGMILDFFLKDGHRAAATLLGR